MIFSVTQTAGIRNPRTGAASLSSTPLLLFLFLFCAPSTLPGQADVGLLLRNVRARFEKVHDYKADLRAELDIPGVRIPSMEATVYFKRPDKFRVVSERFAMLPRDAIAFDPTSLSEDLYDAIIQGTEKIDDKMCVKVKLLAKSDTIRLQRIVAYIDREKWLIRKLSTDPGQGHSINAVFSYTRVGKEMYLPSVITLDMKIPAGSMHRRTGKDKDGKGKEKQASARLEYSNYSVNKGLSDDVFEEK